MSPYETSIKSEMASGASTIESLWAGGNTMEGLSAGVGGAIGAGLGSLFTNGWGGFGGIGVGRGVATGGTELLLLQQQID